ncbi:hypothetical protein RJT34_02356 [Clitoria ternatea]|uniref:BHLH domain-containing protein n=1 Tax=Clitoria ternatea TaxID=43366 RepID=A0AAN9Q3V3_CLITE
MYEESGCFDPNAMMGPQIVSSESDPTLTTTATATQTHNSFGENVGISMYPYSSAETNRVAMEIIAHGSTQDLSLLHHYTATPDLLNQLLHLPISPASPFGNSSVVSFENPTTWVGTDSTNMLNLNLQAPPQYGYTNIQDVGDDERGFAEFTEDVSYVGKKRGGKRTKLFTSTTERQRRVDLGGKFIALKELIPNPSKSDRATVVGDAVEYIRELLRTVNELKLLVEKKRHEKQSMMKRHKVETDQGGGDLNASGDRSYNESLRSCWIQRKSKDTEVDVRIVDNEVTVKLVQRRKMMNCLMHASRVLDELKLDLHHVAGGHVGDFCSFLFNSKICEGSSVYASAIANKLIEVMDTSLTPN